MTQPKIPIGRIGNHALRRAAMLLVFPALIAFYYFLPLCLFPAVVLWRGLVAMKDETGEALREAAATLRRDSLILRAGWRAMWAAPIGLEDDSDGGA